MIFCITRMIWKKSFFRTSCLAYSSIKRTYHPGKEASRILTVSPFFCMENCWESKSFFILLIIHNIWWCLAMFASLYVHGNTERFFELDYDENIIKLFWHSCEKKIASITLTVFDMLFSRKKASFKQTKKSNFSPLK